METVIVLAAVVLLAALAARSLYRDKKQGKSCGSCGGGCGGCANAGVCHSRKKE